MGVAKGRLPKMSTEFCTTPARESDLEVKIIKNDGLGTFLEVQRAFRVAGAGVWTRCKIRGTLAVWWI